MFVSPINECCPIGGGVFKKGKAGSFSVGALSGTEKEAVGKYGGPS